MSEHRAIKEGVSKQQAVVTKNKEVVSIKNKRVSKKKSKTESALPKSSLEIEDVVLLGGDQSDIDFLKEIDEDEDIEVHDEVDDEESLDGEVHEFIAKLGLAKLPKSVPGTDAKKQVSVEPKPISKKNAGSQEVQSKNVTDSLATVLSRIKSYRPRNFLLVKPGGKWYEYKFNSDPVSSAPPSKDILQKLEDFAKVILKDETDTYRKQQEASKKSSVSWLKTVLTSGTQADKMAALVLQIQEAPVHNLSCMDSLIALAKKKSRRESLQVLDTLKELFVTDLLNEHSKLRTFDQHPLGVLDQLTSGNKDAYDKRLLMWYFESQLKKKYAEFVAVVEMLSHDAVEAVRKKSLNVALYLLSERPEQEKKLLSLLVNKLGDPDYKVAANVSHLLSKLIAKHPVMKSVVVGELERLLYRPNVSEKAQYYGVCFLNQLVLSESEQQLASRLLTIYFSFFKVFVKKGEVDSKILSALLTGVNRAYPYAKPDKEKILGQVDTLYKVVHISPFNTSVQALMLIYQVMDVSDSTCDRYYTALYRKLQDPLLQASTKLTMFLNLLFKSLKSDVAEKRVQAFVKRLMQVSKYFSPPFVCSALYMISELVKVRPKVLLLNKVHSKFDNEDDEEERFVDVLDENDEDMAAHKNDTKLGAAVSSWIHRKHSSRGNGTYDPQHRNPLYCNADTDCTWELMSFVNHYHPSVALFARMVLSGQPITYSGDPLEDFTLMRFVDRFVYRNPKKVKEKTASVQSAGAHRLGKASVSGGTRDVPVNSDVFLKKAEDQIPADELFFHKFFNRQAAKRKLPEDMDSDADDVSDGEFDDFLDKFEHGIADADFDVDFATELEKTKHQDKSKTKNKSKDEEDDDSSDEEWEEYADDDLSGEEVDFNDEDFKMDFDIDNDDANGDFDEEEVEFSDDNDDSSKKKLGQKTASSKKKFKKKSDDDGLFAAADEFSHLIETDVELGHMIGTQAVSRKDNAGMKQIKWEMDRDRWVNDKKWKSGSKASGKNHPRRSKLKSIKK